MKKYLLLSLVLAFGGASHLSAQVLTNFSTGGVNPMVVGDFVGSTWVPGTNTSITSSGLVVTNGSNNSGGFSMDFTSTPDSTVPVTQTTNYLTLTANLTSAVPTVDSFEFIVYDSTFADYRAYTFSWSSINHVGPWSFTGTYTPVDSSGTFNGTVGGIQLALHGSFADSAPNVSFQFDQLAFTPTFVPEPSTYAMFGFGLVLLYGVYRRKARQA